MCWETFLVTVTVGDRQQRQGRAPLKDTRSLPGTNAYADVEVHLSGKLVCASIHEEVAP